MEESQSSSTLQNYISSGDNQQSTQPQYASSSLCAQCQNINQIEKNSDSSSQSGSSSHDEGQLVQPLHRHIIEHSRQIQNTIANLQIEVQKLKRANDTKDVLIDQLRKQLKLVQNRKISTLLQKTPLNIQNIKSIQQTEFLRRQKEIQKIRRQIYQNSQNIMKRNLNKNLNENIDENSFTDLKQRMKNIQIKFQDRNGKKVQKQNENIEKKQEKTQSVNTNFSKKIQCNRKIVIQPNDSESQKDQKQNKQCECKYCQKENQNEGKQQFSQKGIQKNRRNTKNNKQSKDLIHKKRNTFQDYKHQKESSKMYQTSSKQNYQSQTNFEYQLNNQLQKIIRLQNHIKFCEDQMLWMTNFIISFLRLGQKLMAMFGQSIVKTHWSFKKKTKISWRYIKHILLYLIS